MHEFYREELKYLKHWFLRNNRKPLIIRGARQVGKSTLVRMFAKESNLKLIELDFEQNPDYASLFVSQDPEKILTLISASINEKINKEHSVLFLDEVQNAVGVFKSIRYFYEKMPELAVIIAGSLLDFVLKEVQFSIPVGRLEYCYLTPISFEGFLQAMQQTSLVDFLQSYSLEDPIPESIHQKLLEFLRIYCIVGGLPAAIASYINDRELIDVMRIHSGLITSYQDDFAKYASISEQQRLRLIYKKIPSMLGEKFKFSRIDPDQKSGQLRIALNFLEDARLIYLVKHTDANGLPLGAEANDKHFKCFFLDIGLVSNALGLNIIDYHHASDLSLINQGKIAEQFIAQELLHLRELFESPQLYYWQRDAKSSKAEIDFVIAHQRHIIPIEVKSGTTGSLKSLHYFLSEKHQPVAVKFCQNPPSLFETQVTVQGKSLPFSLLSLPFYLAGQIRRFV